MHSPPSIAGLKRPAVWTMGNLGRAGYGATVNGLWPYTYDACDVGTVANQSVDGVPAKAADLSYLEGEYVVCFGSLYLLRTGRSTAVTMYLP